MEGLILDINCKLGETHNLTVYSDLHDDARECADKILREHMTRRAALPNAHFAGIGDIANFIMPGPDRRHTPSTPIRELADRDAYIDEEIKRQTEIYKSYPWLFMGMGNHCSAVLQHHFTNPVARLCENLNIPFGGYSGFARLRFNDGTGAGARCTFTLLYHHGAWGGQIIKGLGGAKRWAYAHEGWDAAVYGHNHACHVHQEPMLRMTSGGKIEHRDVFIVNTGTFLRGATQGGSPAYSEIRGYPPVSLAAPLIKITPTAGGCRVSVETGDC